MKKRNVPSFEDDDAGVFFWAFSLDGDTQLARHLCNSMIIRKKKLLNEMGAQKGEERE